MKARQRESLIFDGITSAEQQLGVTPQLLTIALFAVCVSILSTQASCSLLWSSSFLAVGVIDIQRCR